MVMLAGLLAPVYEPLPLPVHPVKENPAFGVAVIETPVPAFLQPLAGETVPPAPAFIVRKYCVVKFAV
jgi:hypothetical protein